MGSLKGFRAKCSKARAQALNLLGFPTGFFTQYDYVSYVQPTGDPYPEVEALCAASPFREFLDEMARHAGVYAGFGRSPGDPVWGRGMFPPLDGAAAYAAVRKFSPRRVLEIGSGDSTYFLARGLKDNGAGNLTCIDPQPRRPISALGVSYEPRVMTDADAALCGELEAGDILFIDSSHIMLPGMDVDIQFNRAFPRLRPGVNVHVHDVFLPFPYPPHWAHRNYSEQNALIGWIVSGFFQILYPGHYVARRHGDAIDAAFSTFPIARREAGSMWLRKT